MHSTRSGTRPRIRGALAATAPDSHFHWPLLRQNIHEELNRLENAYNRNLKKAGVTIARGRAAIRYKNTVVIANGATVRAESILIATGPGIDHVITSNEVLWIAAMAKSNSDSGRRLYSTFEFAGIFAELGSKVILVHRGDNVFHSEFDRPTEATSLTPGPPGYLLVSLR